MLSQSFQEESAEDLDLKNMEINIGVISPLTSPYNLFLNIEQILDPNSEVVYFFVYSFGKKRVVLWGVYLKENEEFVIEGGCRYTVSQLNKYINNWKGKDYSYIGNSVTNRISDVMARELGNKRWAYTEYLRYKFILAYYDNRISETELEERYPEEPDIFLENFYRKYDLSELVDTEIEITEQLELELSRLRNEITKYEKSINRTDLSMQFINSLPTKAVEEIRFLTEKFYEAIKLGRYTEGNYYTALENCPTTEECAQNYNTAGCEVVFYGDEGLGMLSSKDSTYLM